MKVLVVGSAVIDIIMEINSLPKTGDDIACQDITSSVGGCAYNVASTLRHFNIPHDLLIPVGKGPQANIIKEQLDNFGYDILASNPTQDNGQCFCLVEENGERSFITYSGGCF